AGQSSLIRVRRARGRSRRQSSLPIYEGTTYVLLRYQTDNERKVWLPSWLGAHAGGGLGGSYPTDAYNQGETRLSTMAAHRILFPMTRDRGQLRGVEIRLLVPHPMIGERRLDELLDGHVSKLKLVHYMLILLAAADVPIEEREWANLCLPTQRGRR